MRRGLKIAIFISVIIILFGGAFGFYYVQKNSSKPDVIAQDYFNLLNDKNYEEMYSLISEESKKSISKEDFIARNKNIYEGINTRDIEININNVSKSSSNATVDYDMKMNTEAGDVTISNTMSFTKDNGKDFVIKWSSNLIFPDLDNDCKVRISTISSTRGRILDRKGNVLAEDGSVSSVGIVPGKFVDKTAEINMIAEILGMSVDTINKELSASYVTDNTFVPLKTLTNLDERISKLKSISCIQINSKSARIYPLAEAAAHLTGYVQSVTEDDLKELASKGYTSSSVVGKSGVENLYEDTLRGIDGAEIYIIDSVGTKKTTIAKKDVQNGEDIKLTIDSDLQRNLYTQFAEDKSAQVAMNPTTGEVLALVSTPSYNPNSFVVGMSSDEWNALNKDERQPLYNRFKATFAPGSSMKPLTAVIGLDSNALDPNEDKKITGLSWQKDNSWGSYSVTRVSPYDNSNLENALVYSDNIYFAKVALDIGADQFSSKLKSFGFGEEIPFPFGLTNSQYDSDGTISSEVQLADSGYGQGEVLVNPVHHAAMYSMFFNKGSIITPTLVYGDSKSRKMWKDNVATEASCNTVLNDMKQVVENPSGTASSLKIDGLSLAAKTGTAELKATQDDTSGTEIGWLVATTTDKGNNNVMIVSMCQDVKDLGGSHYLIPKVRNVFLSVK